MKIMSFLLTMLLHLNVVYFLNYFKNFSLIIIIFLVTLIVGFAIKQNTATENKIAKEIGWGLLYGSVTMLILALGFMASLYFIFPANARLH